MVDTEGYAGDAVAAEGFATEKACQGFVLEVGICQLSIQGGPFGEAVKITDAVFAGIAGIIVAQKQAVVRTALSRRMSRIFM